MFSHSKKYLFIVLIIAITASLYFLIFGEKWAISINNEHVWQYGFQKKEELKTSSISWKQNDSANAILEKNRSNNLIFQTTFNVDDKSQIVEGVLEYEFRYTCTIFINDIKYKDVHRNLITPSGHSSNIAVMEYWRPRQVHISQEFLDSALANGENTIKIVVYNTDEIKWISTNKKQLSFLCKGNAKGMDPDFEIDRPKEFFTKSNLPIFRVNTFNKPIPDKPKIGAELNIIDSRGVNSLKDTGTTHKIKIELRGNTSQTFSKKSYGFNLYDSNSQKTSLPLLGMPASKKWVLYGPYADKSLIRNAVAYSLYNQMGNYTPKTQIIDLVINNNYQGIYLLTEKIQVGPNHVSINKLTQNENDSTKITGGYILEVDRNDWKSVYPRKGENEAIPLSYMVYSPKKLKINTLTEAKIKNQFNQFEKKLYQGDSIFNYLDLSSFVDYLIITEVARNIDGYRLSTFIYNKDINDKNSKFYVGPIWDYNFSFGLANYHDGYKTEGYVYNTDKYVPFWWKTLLNNSAFKNALKERYFELRKSTLSSENINQTVDSFATTCKASSDINFKKWPVLNSPDFWPNYYTGESYQDEVDYIKSWTKKRLEFLDKEFQSSAD